MMTKTKHRPGHLKGFCAWDCEACKGEAMLHTTVDLLKHHDACVDGFSKLVKHLGGIASARAFGKIPLTVVLDSNGLADALWCLGAVLPEEEGHRDIIARLFAADCAEAVQHLYMPPVKDTGWRPQQTIRVTRRYALGMATRQELASAKVNASDKTTVSAWASARDSATDSARDSAWVSARESAMDSAWAIAMDSSSVRISGYLREWLDGTRTIEQVRARLAAEG